MVSVQTTPCAAVAYHLMDTDVGRGTPQTTPRAPCGRAGCMHDRGRIFAGLPAAVLLGSGAGTRFAAGRPLSCAPARAGSGLDQCLRRLRTVPRTAPEFLR